MEVWVQAHREPGLPGGMQHSCSASAEVSTCRAKQNKSFIKRKLNHLSAPQIKRFEAAAQQGQLLRFCARKGCMLFLLQQPLEDWKQGTDKQGDKQKSHHLPANQPVARKTK